MTRYRHIIWDWNGTLFDDAWLCIEIINDLLARRGLPLVTRERYEEEFTFPVQDYYRQVGFDLEREPFAGLAKEFTTAYDARRFACRLQPAAREVLQAFARAGRTQSVLSAYEQRRLEEMVTYTGIHPHFTRVMGLNDYYAVSKVDQGRRCITELAHPLTEVLLIGDTLHDAEVAATMGIDCLLVPSGHASPARLARSGARIVPSLEALFEQCVELIR